VKGKDQTKYIAAVVTAGVLWGFMGLFRRKLADLGFSAGGIVLVRCGLAAVLLLATLLVCDRGALKVKLRDLWCFLGSGLCSMLFFTYCYYQAMNYTSLSAAAILLYTAPAIVVLLSAVLFREAFTRRKCAALILAFFGCCLVSGIGGDMRVSWLGILYGIGSGFGYALYSIFARFALQRGYSSLTVTFYTCLFAAVGAGLIWGFHAPVALIFASKESVFWSLGIAFFTCYLAYLLYTYSLTGLETGMASILTNIEPVVATAVGMAVFHEPMTPANFSGILCVLGAVILLGQKEKSGQTAK
jgi:drug/metabolite transporter (DMT)-like permease